MSPKTARKTAASNTRKLGKTPEERRAQLEKLSARLDAWIEDHGDEEEATFEIMCENYSERNAGLIAMQCPGATVLRTYGAWQALGRQVNPRPAELDENESWAIMILAPAGESKPTDEQKAAAAAEGKDAKSRQFFSLTARFDISQTHVMTDEEKEKLAARQARKAAKS